MLCMSIHIAERLDVFPSTDRLHGFLVDPQTLSVRCKGMTEAMRRLPMHVNRAGNSFPRSTHGNACIGLEWILRSADDESVRIF